MEKFRSENVKLGRGIVIGLQKDAEYHCGEIKLNQNDLILYYTDGVIDTSNSLGERFDEKRLIKTLRNYVNNLIHPKKF